MCSALLWTTIEAPCAAENPSVMGVYSGNLITMSKSLLFYVSPQTRCSYLPDRETVSLFVDPYAQMSTTLYARLIDKGFRRSGRYVYRPHCPHCKACVSTRIPVAHFRPNRSQRRTLKLNQDVEVIKRSAEYRDEHFQLYRRYVNTRHAGGEMENPTPETYSNFLKCDWVTTLFAELRVDQTLIGVAVCDVLPQGLSAVYTFFDPDHERRGLGTFAILWQIAETRLRNMSYVYLGYWIEKNRKMSYKTRFRPIEGLIDDRWQRLQVGDQA